MHPSDQDPPTPKIPAAPVQIQSLSSTKTSAFSVMPAVTTPGSASASKMEALATPVLPIAGQVNHGPIGLTPSVPKENLLKAYWRKMGAGSLIMSLLIHVGLLVIASFIVTTVVNEKISVDFLPGGGSKAGQEASSLLNQQVKQKKRSLMNKSTPMQKIVSTSTNSAIALSDIPVDSIDMPEMSSILGGGTMGSAGFGSNGSGGGFGNGMGIGGMSGKTFKPIIIFGNELKARSIAVIMDVSGSMTPHLTKVIKELDRVAKGSPVVLYVGCGVATPAKGKKLDDNAISTRRQSKSDDDKNFEIFWRKSHGKPKPPVDPNAPPPSKKKDDKDGPIPEEPVYAVMADRPSTYFIKSQGIEYAWMSLLVNEVRNAEALYWFSDFQDKVDDEQLEAVLKNIKRRKQKLFIHASVEGNSFAKIRDQLCLPSGGAVISEQKKDGKKPDKPVASATSASMTAPP